MQLSIHVERVSFKVLTKKIKKVLQKSRILMTFKVLKIFAKNMPLNLFSLDQKNKFAMDGLKNSPKLLKFLRHPKKPASLR